MAGVTSLQRRIGLGGAVVVGLGSMLGAGVFTVWGPAAAAAGSASGLLLALALAAAVATLNALSTAQLAARLPTSGGAYAFGRAMIGPRVGFAAGWMFVVGKTASCAAMALVAATAIVADGAHRTGLAVALLIGVTVINLLGVSRTTRATAVLAVVTLGILVVTVWWIARLDPDPQLSPTSADPSLGGTLQAAALIFFAFAGYARIATLGEEVVRPLWTIPRAVVIALIVAATVYLAVAIVLIDQLGMAGLGGSVAPLALAVGDAGAIEVLVRIGAIAASLGALLALSAGLGRTTMAMAREGDLPTVLAVVDQRFASPARAQIAVALVACALVVTIDVSRIIAVSSFGVLVYYTVAGVSAARQERAHRIVPPALSLLGAATCLLLVVSLPGWAVAAGALVLVLGVSGREIVQQRLRRHR